jgi:hypothetical protein
MNFKGFRRKRLWTNLRYYPGSCLEGLRKTTKNLSQDIRSLDRDLNPGSPRSANHSTTTFGMYIIRFVTFKLLGPTILFSTCRIYCVIYGTLFSCFHFVNFVLFLVLWLIPPLKVTLVSTRLIRAAVGMHILDMNTCSADAMTVKINM